MRVRITTLVFSNLILFVGVNLVQLKGQSPQAYHPLSVYAQEASLGAVTADKFLDTQNTAYFLDPASSGASLTVAGSVGIGTTNPIGKLHVGSASRDGYIPVGLQIHSIYETSSRSGDSLANLFAAKQTDGTANSIQALEAYTYTANPTSTTINLALTSIANLEHAGAGTINDARGLDGSVFLSGSGNIGSAYGLMADVYLLGSSSGNITNGYAGYFGIDDAGLGTISNGYGVYINDIKATNDYGIYQESANDDNYFAGNVGVGTKTPTSLLQVGKDGYLQFSKTSAGRPVAADCEKDNQRGRLVLDTNKNRLYICNGSARGWDYLPLQD